jgi:hypothetical protein
MRDLLEVLPIFATGPYDRLANVQMSDIVLSGVLSDGWSGH